MPNLNEMFPSKYLQAEDLERGRNTVVTIDRIYPAAARDRGHGDEPEVKWMVRFREYRKPMSLWRTTARTIAEVLGTDRTEEWAGQQIAIFPGTYVSFGETKPCVNVDRWRPEQTAAPASGLVIINDKRPIPEAAMSRFRAHLSSNNKTWEDFLKWSKVAAPDVITLAFGVDFDAIPAGVLPAMKAYLDSLAAPQPGSVVAGVHEVIDRRTGEVRSAPVRDAIEASKRQSPAPTPAGVDESDIPF